MYSNSVMLRVESIGGCEEWFTSNIKPWVHYVPVKSDASDLVEKVKWLRDNDDKAKEISQTAREFVKTYATNYQINKYIWESFMTYSKLYH